MFAKTLLGSLAAVVLTSAGLAHALPNQIDFLIKSGAHKDRQGIGIAHLTLGKKTRVLSFKALFASSAAYRTKSPSNQGDACKLLGITTANIHGTSLRLGWAYNPATNKMTLRLYAYLNGARINEPVTEVALNAWHSVELRIGNDGVSAQVNGTKVSRPTSAGFRALTSTWVLKTAYFGGDETAPQDIAVQVKDIAVH